MTNEEKLLHLLFDEGRVLLNIKFSVADGCKDVDKLFGAVYDMIKASLDGNCINGIKKIDKQYTIEEMTKIL